jgi:hypothetical protein
MEDKNFAPVCLFTYKRLQETKQTVESLQRNFLANESELFIFSDGPKSDRDRDQVNQVREYIKSISGFKNITVFESSENKGLANSIIAGVTQIIERYGKAIVLEDDLITSLNFLIYMNKALDFYKTNPKVFSIAGYTVPIKKIAEEDIYFTQRASSWGWATWKNCWEKIDWEIKNFDKLKKDSNFRRAFNKMGSDMYKMLNAQMSGRINSWAIRWCYNQFQMGQYTVFPTISKVLNIGTSADATHTKVYPERFYTVLDISGNKNFTFTDKIELNPHYIKQFLNPFRFSTRLKYKLLNLLLANKKIKFRP